MTNLLVIKLILLQGNDTFKEHFPECYQGIPAKLSLCFSPFCELLVCLQVTHLCEQLQCEALQTKDIGDSRD